MYTNDARGSWGIDYQNIGCGGWDGTGEGVGFKYSELPE